MNNSLEYKASFEKSPPLFYLSSCMLGGKIFIGREGFCIIFSSKKFTACVLFVVCSICSVKKIVNKPINGTQTCADYRKIITRITLHPVCIFSVYQIVTCAASFADKRRKPFNTQNQSRAHASHKNVHN